MATVIGLLLAVTDGDITDIIHVIEYVLTYTFNNAGVHRKRVTPTTAASVKLSPFASYAAPAQDGPKLYDSKPAKTKESTTAAATGSSDSSSSSSSSSSSGHSGKRKKVNLHLKRR
jgi:hypothetical protein